MNITLVPRRLTGFFAAVLVFLALANAALEVMNHVYGHNRLFGLASILTVNGEHNFGTWLSSCLLLLCALLLATIGASKTSQGDRYALHWMFLAAVFVFLSIDETATIHETVARMLRKRFAPTGLLYSGWIVPWVAFALGLAAAYLGFLRHLPRRTVIGFVASGALYVGASAGVEAFQGRGLEAARLAHVVGRGELTAQLEVLGCIEELLEMTAMVLFAHTLLRYLGANVRDLHICVADGTSDPPR